MNSPQKSYKVRAFNANMYLFLGSILLLVSLFFGLIAQTGLGLLFIVLGMVDKNRAIFKLFDEHLEFKPGAIASVQMIRYNHIENIELVKKKIIISLKPGTAKKQKIKIATQILEKEDVPDLIDKIRQRVSSVETSMPVDKPHEAFPN